MGMTLGRHYMDGGKGCGGYNHRAIKPKLVAIKESNTAKYDKAYSTVPFHDMPFPLDTDVCPKENWPKGQPGLVDPYDAATSLPLLYKQVLESAPLMFEVVSRLRPLFTGSS